MSRTRKPATEIRPGDMIEYRNGLRIAVKSVTVRHGFSGPLAVVVDHSEGRDLYAPTARLTVVRGGVS